LILSHSDCVDLHMRIASKSVAGDTTQYVLDLAATLPAVISDTEAGYLYGLDSIVRKREGCTNHGTGAVPRCTP